MRCWQSSERLSREAPSSARTVPPRSRPAPEEDVFELDGRSCRFVTPPPTNAFAQFESRRSKILGLPSAVSERAATTPKKDGACFASAS